MIGSLVNLFDVIRQLETRPEPSALCTVVAISGSTPRKVGAKMIVISDGSDRGSIRGSIGGGAIEHHIRQCALKALAEAQPRLVTTSLRNDLAMCCGGEMTVFIEPLPKALKLICFGAGHIAQSLCPLADALGFRVSVIDSRRELLELSVFASAVFRSHDHSVFGIQSLNLSSHTYVVVLTHDHQLDQQIIEHAINYPVKYLGLVGSRRKALMTAKRLQAKGYSQELIRRFICPAGLAINAQTPAEIAVSIMAQITGIKNDSSTSDGLDCSGRSQQAHGLSKSPPADQWGARRIVAGEDFISREA
jgi:xanthine dehydrogenase accessory factor